MKRSKTIIRMIVPALVLAGVGIMLFTMLESNKQRIMQNNAQYTKDIAVQKANRINDLLESAEDSIASIAYLYGIMLESPEVDQEVLNALSRNSAFQYIEFIDSQGVDHTYDGREMDVSERFYYQDGIRGHSGIDVVFDSRFDNETVVVFYAPLRYDGDIIGVLAGHYRQAVMTNLISSSFLDHSAEAYLFLSNGDVISSSVENNRIGNLMTDAREPEEVDEEELELFRDTIEARESASFIYTGKAGSGTAYVTGLPDYDWMLLQSFPAEVTQSMFEDANLTGIRMAAGMAVLFAVYIAVLLYMNYSQRRELMKEMSREIQYLKRLFDIMAQNTADIFILFSPKTLEADYVGGNVEGLLGLSKEEISRNARSLGRASVDGSEVRHEDVVAAVEKNGVYQLERELRNMKTGEHRWYRETFYRVVIQDTERYILVLSDRTVELQMNESLKQALDMAKSANEAKSQFLSNMSHDIRTPMNAIVGFSVLLDKDAEHPDKVREYTRKITASSQHLLGLINDVLDMSKIESGKTSLNVTEFRMPELLEELNAVMRPQAKAKKQQFDIQIKGKVPEVLIGDKLRVSQILMNLLSNAVKYTPEHGEIRLVVERSRQTSRRYASLRFVVQDNGIGMSGEFVKRIFEPFVREDDQRVHGIQGTGLGMTITKNLVDMMGGTISVESELNRGSAFAVDLEFPVREPGRDQHFWEEHGIQHVLAVDDEEDVCMGIQELMSDTGVEVSYTTDGQEAVRLAEAAHQRQEDYNVILLDWKMPGMDGIETARRIRRQVGNDVPLLVLTAYDWSGIEAEAREAGIDSFLAKPFFESSFRMALEQLDEREHQETGEAGGADNGEGHTAGKRESLEGMMILVAEDNDINAEILTELLALDGVRCERAVDGQEAVDLFNAASPGYYDMILMDIQMPAMNGYEATEAIRNSSHEDARRIPIVAMTANAFEEDVKRALNSGMNAHVAKPVNLELLRKVLSGLKDWREQP